MYAPFGATALLSCHGLGDGRWILRWAMPDRTVKETISYTTYLRKVGMSQRNEGQLLQRLWELLDSKLDIIVPHDPDDNMEKAALRERTKNEARGIAEALAVLMDPFITDSTEVARHAGKRWKARQAGERYDVPGLADAIWDPTKNWDGTDRVLPTVGKRKPAPAPTINKMLTDAETTAIKQALTTGMFTVEQLAGVYKVSVQQIESLR